MNTARIHARIQQARMARKSAAVRCFARAAAERFDFFAKCERCGGTPVDLFCPTKLKCPKCKRITWR